MLQIQVYDLDFRSSRKCNILPARHKTLFHIVVIFRLLGYFNLLGIRIYVDMLNINLIYKLWRHLKEDLFRLLPQPLTPQCPSLYIHLFNEFVLGTDLIKEYFSLIRIFRVVPSSARYHCYFKCRQLKFRRQDASPASSLSLEYVRDVRTLI